MRTEKARGLSHDVVSEIASSLRPKLSSRKYLKSAGAVTKDKGGGHLAHRIDQDAEGVLLAGLARRDFDGALFSEEAGLLSLGTGSRFVVSDPYCNTSLTFRGVRESAVTAYEFDADNELASAAIADLQIPRSVYITAKTVPVIAWEEGDKENAVCSTETELGSACVVLSVLKKRRRNYLDSIVARDVANLLTVDGGIVALRMCAAEIDAFVDHEYGQPAYEALAYLLVQHAGGVVTDGRGQVIDWRAIVGELRRGYVRRQTLVAAGTEELHRALLRALG